MPTLAELMRKAPVGYDYNPEDNRDYIGYEDYTPEGRAALKEFIANKGGNYLRRQLATYPQYQNAQQQAMLAGYLKLLQRQGTDTGMPVYKYPLYPPEENNPTLPNNIFPATGRYVK